MIFYRLYNSMKKYVPENFFTWITFFYKIKGLSPPKNPIFKILYLALAVPHIFMCTFLLIFLEWAAFAFCDRAFKDRMLDLSVTTLNTILAFRTIVWVFTRSKLDNITELVSRRSFNFDCFRIIKAGRKHQLIGEQMHGQGERLLRFEDFGKVWEEADLIFDASGRNELESMRIERMFHTRLLCCVMHLSVTFLSISDYILAFGMEISAGTYEDFNPFLNKTSVYRKFKYLLYLPFDTSYDGHYWAVFIYNCYSHIGNMFIFLPIETTLTCTLIHLISQTTVLNEAFKYIDKNISLDQDSKGLNLIREIRIVKCINELQEIYKAVELLEALCNIQLMVQYGCVTFLICSLCYVIPLVETIMEAICLILYLIAVLGQIFIFSYCCQTLALELQKVATSAYNVDWPNYSPKLRSTLRILIGKAQKPANLTAGKIVVIDLLFFIQVVQKSYSFYTLITNTT